MKIHYFQRYHGKENVATANTMLLLSRLYSNSPSTFYDFLRSEFFSNSFDPEIIFRLQEKNAESTPDATISQEGFKLVVETKRSDSFSSDQLMRHLKSFGDEKHKIIMTLAPKPMSGKKKASFEKQLDEYNKNRSCRVIHINTTFDQLANAIKDFIDDMDYDMQEILEDYLDYCYHDNLIPESDSWKFMRMQLAGATFDFNVSSNLYYDNAERGFRPHKYLGLYKNKSVRAMGLICARITAEKSDDGLKYEVEYGELTDERKEKITSAIQDGYTHGYDLLSHKQRYFFVEQFYETDFKKITPRPSMGTRIFDLSQILSIDSANEMPDESLIAELLKEKTWT